METTKSSFVSISMMRFSLIMSMEFFSLTGKLNFIPIKNQVHTLIKTKARPTNFCNTSHNNKRKQINQKPGQKGRKNTTKIDCSLQDLNRQPLSPGPDGKSIRQIYRLLYECPRISTLQQPAVPFGDYEHGNNNHFPNKQ